ncbi:MAG: transposase [Acidobacteria bacterium]|nr:transposase [Acidobacteriota bacterium]
MILSATTAPFLKSLSDDETGPQLTVYVPPKGQQPRHPELFQLDDFTLNETGDELTCPQGETTQSATAMISITVWIFYYSVKKCRNLPIECAIPHAWNKTGVAESIITISSERYLKAVQQRVTTDEYKQIRKEHPRIERKLNELVRWHSGRHVRYRHRFRVKVQYLLLAVVVNCKRIVRILEPALQPQSI